MFLRIALLYLLSITVFCSFRPIKYSESEKINSLSGEVAKMAVGHNQAQDKKFGFVDEDANLNCWTVLEELLCGLLRGCWFRSFLKPILTSFLA